VNFLKNVRGVNRFFSSAWKDTLGRVTAARR
jgi:hypothetical protein